MATTQLPFDLNQIAYKKLIKLPGITNWTFKMNKKRNNSLVVDYWTPGDSKNIGQGYVAGCKTTPTAYVKNEIDVSEIHYDDKCDSWILKSKSGVFYRAPWPNAYRNPDYPHHSSRADVNTIIASCSNLKIW
jgi:hypothetical protein